MIGNFVNIRGHLYLPVNFVVIRRETEKAFQLILEDGSICWIPKSQVDDVKEYAAGLCDGVMHITNWIADQKGLHPGQRFKWGDLQ